MWAAALLLVATFSANADFVVPVLTGPVVDNAGILSATTREGLANYLQDVLQKGGPQVQVATVKDLGGLSIEEASIKVVDQWKLGKAKDDRGVLLLIANTEHKIRIEVGRGLEGDLTDVTSSRIIRDVIVPRFQQGSPDRGVVDGVAAIMHYAAPNLAESAGDESAPQPVQASGAVHHRSPLGRVLTILFWLVILIVFLRGGGGGFGTLLGLSMLSGSGRGSSWGGGGGGWSGGGGGFSGGGASGGW